MITYYIFMNYKQYLVTYFSSYIPKIVASYSCNNDINNIDIRSEDDHDR